MGLNGLALDQIIHIKIGRLYDLEQTLIYEGSTFYVNMTEYRRVMDDVSLGCEADAVFPLDEWAQDFVYLVDESAEFTEDYPVSALDALCFLAASCMAHGLLEVQYV
jgi:hypothetical protein